jgi:hypothetical protein
VNDGAKVAEVPETAAPLSVNDACPETDQVKVLVIPCDTVVGLAVNDEITGGSGTTVGVTVNAKMAVPVPPGFVAPSTMLYVPATMGEPDM